MIATLLRRRDSASDHATWADNMMAEQTGDLGYMSAYEPTTDDGQALVTGIVEAKAEQEFATGPSSESLHHQSDEVSASADDVVKRSRARRLLAQVPEQLAPERLLDPMTVVAATVVMSAIYVAASSNMSAPAVAGVAVVNGVAWLVGSRVVGVLVGTALVGAAAIVGAVEATSWLVLKARACRLRRNATAAQRHEQKRRVFLETNTKLLLAHYRFHRSLALRSREASTKSRTH